MGVFGAHADLALWVFLWLTQISQIPLFLLMVGNLTEALRFVAFCGLTQIQRDSTRRLFVGICVNSWLKNLRKNIRVIRGICGFKATPQISTNFYKLFVG